MRLSDDTLGKAVAAALGRTAAWIDSFGGRLAGSQACQMTAREIFNEFERICGGARREEFITHPRAFTGFYRIDVILYLVGLALLFFHQPLPAALLLTFMVVAAGLEFGWYIEFYDRFYQSHICTNITTVLEPRGPVLRQLIFSGHHDSAPELSFLKRSQKLYALKIILPDFFRIAAMTFAIAWLAWQWLSGATPPFATGMLAFLVIGTPSVLTKFFLFSKEAVPGAGDNLIASAMLVELANLFASHTHSGYSTLENTRLIFTSFDAEESGLRGSRAWVRDHHTEIEALPTYALNIDSIYSVKDLQFLISDLNGHIRLDGDLVQRCLEIAQKSGFPARPALMRFGGGATDAAELVRAGVKATTMIAMPAGVVRDGLVYHTMQDTISAVEPAAVEACLRVAQELAIELDTLPQN